MLIEVKKIQDRLFGIRDQSEFDTLALQIFQWQAKEVPIYKNFIKRLNIVAEEVKKVEDIPFLPIEFFKTHRVCWKDESIQQTFESSGTTGSITSKHHVVDLKLYERASKVCFEHFFGPLQNYSILALLPSYLERGNSSLVYMTKKFMEWTGHENNGFFLDQKEDLIARLKSNESERQKTLLLGVTFGLLDLCEAHKINLSQTTVIETGGMKGRKKEQIRSEIHSFLANRLGVNKIGSEYGMTELLSQAWSKADGIFYTPPWMQVQTREVNDPFSKAKLGKTGGINIIDLANIYSCSFIATSDLGRKHEDGGFEVLGRYDHSDVRGCNLMAISD